MILHGHPSDEGILTNSDVKVTSELLLINIYVIKYRVELTNDLTSWSTVSLQTLIVAHVVERSLDLYGTLGFSTVFTTTHYCNVYRATSFHVNALTPHFVIFLTSTPKPRK